MIRFILFIGKKDWNLFLQLFVYFLFTESDREDYVDELQKFFPVHVYGRCGWKYRNGNYTCPENDPGPTYDMKSKCFDSISKNYMFYLSFENSMCLDYVTEKFFKALNFGILPIVLGKFYKLKGQVIYN